MQNKNISTFWLKKGPYLELCLNMYAKPDWVLTQTSRHSGFPQCVSFPIPGVEEFLLEIHSQ